MYYPGMDLDALWARHSSGDRAAREELILAFLPLVKATARKVGGKLPSNIEFDDLVSYGTFGMIESLDRFDPSMGNKFETFAMKRIQGSIIDGLRAMEWTPRTVYSQGRDLDRATTALATNLQRAPVDREIAADLGWDEEKVNTVRARSARSGMAALDEQMGEDNITLGDSLSDKAMTPYAQLEMSELQRGLATAIETLSEKERTVLVLYYFELLKFSEIGEMFKVSESRICQIHMSAIENIRSGMTS